MIQYVMCNKSWLFTKTKKLQKNKKKKNILVEQENNSNVFEMKHSNSFLYEIETWTTLQCNLNWIQIHWMEFEFKSIIGLRFNWKINGMQIGGKGIENILVNMVLKK
jgi:hypothetical protein